MTDLPTSPTIVELQKFVSTRCKERGWDNRTDIERLMFMIEEVGEVAKEVRKISGKYGYKHPGNTDHLGEELVDVLNFVIDLANSNDIDLEKAFRAKWLAVATRRWET